MLIGEGQSLAGGVDATLGRPPASAFRMTGRCPPCILHRRYSRGGPVPATDTGRPRREPCKARPLERQSGKQEDAHVMANAENGLVSPESTGGQPGAPRA